MTRSNDRDFHLRIAVPVDFHFVPVHALAVHCVVGLFFVSIFGPESLSFAFSR